MIFRAVLIAATLTTSALAVEVRDAALARSMIAQWKAVGLVTGVESAQPIGREESDRCGTLVVSLKQRFSMFSGDVNNDGADDFTLVRRCVDGTQRDVVHGFAQRGDQGWKWTPFEAVLADSKVLATAVPAQIDPMEFPRRMSTGVWVIPFRTESWFLKEGKLTPYRPDQLRRSRTQ